MSTVASTEKDQKSALQEVALMAECIYSSPMTPGFMWIMYLRNCRALIVILFPLYFSSILCHIIRLAGFSHPTPGVIHTLINAWEACSVFTRVLPFKMIPFGGFRACDTQYFHCCGNTRSLCSSLEQRSWHHRLSTSISSLFVDAGKVQSSM